MDEVVNLTVQPQRSLLGDALRRMFKNPLTVVGALLVALALFCAIFAPIAER